MVNELQDKENLKFDTYKQSPLDLANMIKEAINQGKNPVKVACNDSEFVYNLIMNKSYDFNNHTVRARKVLVEVLKEVGLSSEFDLKAEKRINERKLERSFFEPYSTYLVYIPKY